MAVATVSVKNETDRVVFVERRRENGAVKSKGDGVVETQADGVLAD